MNKEEWDFAEVPNEELIACCYWEYARESARIRAFYSPENSDFFPSPGTNSKLRDPLETTILSPLRPVTNSERMRFMKLLWEYALPVKATADRAYRAGLEHAFDRPWQNLPTEVRRGAVKELAPYFAEKPGLTFLPFNRCSDLRDIGLAGDGYRCAKFDVATGIERFRAEIDWAGFTDAQIVEAFRTWVKENRPPGVGRGDDRGHRKGAGFELALKAVGILRLMNVCPVTRIRERHPPAWRRYRTMDWPRARHKAGRTFRELFCFLPEDDRPLHWETAGGRAI